MSEPTVNFHVKSGVTQFKVPTELIKKNFKTIQKLIEKQKKQLTNDIAKIKKNDKLPATIKLEMIRKHIRSFEGFQKKLHLVIERDQEFRLRLEARLDNLNELSKYTIEGEDEGEDEGKDEGEDEEEENEDREEHMRSNSFNGNGNDNDNDNDNSISSKSRKPSILEPKKNRSSTIDTDDRRLDLHNNNLINWYRDQANLLIIDYLIKSNVRHEQSIGSKLLKNLSVLNPKFMKLIDYDLFENFNKVFVSIIENHDLTLVIAWFEENRTPLKKVNSNLEFEINYCKFLSLIEAGKTDEAINFSQVNLSPSGNRSNYLDQGLVNYENNLNKLKEIGGLLVYMAINESPKTTNTTEISNNNNGTGIISFSSLLVKNSPRSYDYQKLLSDDRWISLSECFMENFTKLYGISKNYPLFIYLSAGLSSLKTKSCYCNHENTIFLREGITKPIPTSEPLTDRKFRGPNYYYKMLNKINNCPVCSPELYKLSRNLPYAQLITNIFNNPFKLPNGNIYPFDKLTTPNEKYLSEKDSLLRDGMIKDPLTKEVFSIDECSRVYAA